MHYKRAEHWVVVMGVATVVNGEKVFSLIKGQSTYIPLETKHSLENLEKTQKTETHTVQGEAGLQTPRRRPVRSGGTKPKSLPELYVFEGFL